MFMERLIEPGMMLLQSLDLGVQRVGAMGLIDAGAHGRRKRNRSTLNSGISRKADSTSSNLSRRYGLTKSTSSETRWRA